MTATRVAIAVLVLIVDCQVDAAPPKLPTADPSAAQMDPERLSAIDSIVTQGIERGEMPGAVVLIARRGLVVHHRAYGHRTIEPDREPMTTDTVFDLASITKPVATATSIMRLVESGKVNPDAPVGRYLPEFAANGKQDVTVYQLLTHQGGLIPDNSIRDYDDGPRVAMNKIYNLDLHYEPGTRFSYTDVGFIVLADVVQRITGKNIDAFSREQIFAPLGMQDTGFRPDESLRLRCAATEMRNGRWIRGEVHDPRAFRLGGVAGHAGLFATAADLAVYAQMMIAGGEYAGVRILQADTIQRMTARYQVPRGFRGLGWDKQSPYSSNRGDLLSESAFGHGGFTGTVLWIDPEHELTIIFLSSRLHPDGKGSVNRLAGRIATVAAAAVIPEAHTERKSGSKAPIQVRTGIDVLRSLEFEPLADQRVGLITNHTGVDRRGLSTVEILRNAEEVKLVALFSPEHGFEGQLDQAVIDDAADPTTGLRIHSLYGKTRTPTAEMLENVDTLVFDIQDIGTRFYTYISTMGNAMTAAAEHGQRFIVLDRPNPINGIDVAGPILDRGRESFVGFHQLPVRHGMTVGELARMFKAERGLNLDLQVIPVQGWNRADYFDRTGLEWINPSPNMRSLTEAVLYPGIGLLETSNISVGRGTDTPFEILGAPWMDAQRLADRLNDSGLEGVRFLPRRFTPDASRYKDEVCQGVNIIVTNRSQFRPVRTGITIAVTLRRLYPEEWTAEQIDRLLINRQALTLILGAHEPAHIESAFAAALDDFRTRRAQYLFYK